MTEEETKKAIEVKQAYVDGKDIEVYNDSKIIEAPFPTWQWGNNPTRYRVKPEPKFRPFKSADEVMEAINKRGCWLKDDYGVFFSIKRFDDDSAIIGSNSEPLTYLLIYNDFVFADGTPFGKLVEE